MGGGIGGIGQFDREKWVEQHRATLSGAELAEFDAKEEERRENMAREEARSSDSILGRIALEAESKAEGLQKKVDEFESIGKEQPDRSEVIQKMLGGQLDELKKKRQRGGQTMGGRGADGSPVASQILTGN